MKFKNIVKKSKKIIKNVKKNQELPEKINKEETLLLLSRSILECGVNKKVIHVEKAPNIQKVKTNMSLSQKEYVDLAAEIVNFIEKNKRCPNVLKYNGVKISVDLAIYAFSKIIYSFSKNNKLPNKVKFKSSVFETKCKNPYKALPYDAQSGCDHMGQNTGYFCACSMLQKMFYELGYKVSQDELARVAGTTTAGTGHLGIETAIAHVGRKFNVKFNCYWKNLSDFKSWKELGELSCSKNASIGTHILYRGQWGHYEKILTIDIVQNIVKVINSLGNKCTSSCYCGYIEERSMSLEKRYISGISQKSILVIEKV